MDLDKELQKVSNWMIVDIVHERYSFETNVRLFNYCPLQTVLDEYMIPRDEIEKYLEKPREKYFPEEHNYNLDRTVRNPLDTKYSFPYLEGLPLVDIHLDTMHIIDMKYLTQEEHVSFIWGSTDKKFGLIDIDREKINK